MIDEIFKILVNKIEEMLFSSGSFIMTTVHAPKKSGLYALYHDNNLVYVGKTINLCGRLSKHKRTIDDAELISTDQMQYRFVECSEEIMESAEKCLIKKHNPPWNSTGFGSNAHGNGRSNQKLSEWNKMYGRKVTR